MKTYLNSEERRNAFLLIATQIIFKEFVEKSGANMDKKEHRYIRTGLTYLDKWLVELFKRVGPIDGEKIKRESNGQEIIIRPKAFVKEKEFINLEKEEFYDLADGILFSYCKGCGKTGDSVDKCSMRRLMCEHDVPSFKNHGQCEYMEVEK